MNDLVTTLGTVRERIAKFRGQAIGEENTKHSLIEPVLKALGWDVEDLDQVQCEYRYTHGGDPVDYALLQDGVPCLFVEAKALGENLDKWAHQVMGYTGVAGVGWALLTDGNEYRIYNAGASGDIAEKLFRRVLVEADRPELAQTLVLLAKDQLRAKQIEVLWRREKIDHEVQDAVEGLAAEAPKEFVNLLRKRVRRPLSAAEVVESLARFRVTLEYRVAPPAWGGVAPLGLAREPVAAGPGQPTPERPAAGPIDKTPWRHVTLQDLIRAGSVQPPLDLETTYKGQRLVARIEPGGTVTWNGTTYDSLSTAGGMARKSVVGAPPGREYPQTNGWGFWRVRDTGGSLVLLDVLRQRHFTRR